MDGGSVTPDEKKLEKELFDGAENKLQELSFIKNGEGIYDLYSVMTDGLIKYRDAYIAAGGNGPVTGWADGIKTMYGGAVFRDDEVRQVEEFMNKHGTTILGGIGLIDNKEKNVQSGGAPTIDIEFLLEQAKKHVDPRLISLDGVVTFILEFMNLMNSKSEDLSRQVGILKLENTVHGVPLQQFGIPGEVPTRLLVVILQGIFEVLRLISLFGFPGSGLLRMFGSISGGLLEAAKGDIKSALFTFMGVMGSTAVVIGAFGKITVKVMSLINNNTRDKLIYAGYESFKSMIVGTAIFLFTTLAPLSIKTMVDEQLQKLLEKLGNIQEKQDALRVQLEADPAIKGKYRLEFPNFKNLHIDFDSLQRLQDLFTIPQFYCNAAVKSFINQMKLVPPARILLELMGIPTTEVLLKQSCMNVSDEAMSDTSFMKAILQAMAPRLIPITAAASGDIELGSARDAITRIFGSISGSESESATPTGSSSGKPVTLALLNEPQQHGSHFTAMVPYNPRQKAALGQMTGQLGSVAPGLVTGASQLASDTSSLLTEGSKLTKGVTGAITEGSKLAEGITSELKRVDPTKAAQMVTRRAAQAATQAAPGIAAHLTGQAIQAVIPPSSQGIMGRVGTGIMSSAAKHAASQVVKRTVRG